MSPKSTCRKVSDMQSSNPERRRPPLRGIAAAAEYLGVSQRFACRHRENGIPSIRVGKRTLLFDPDALDVWLASHTSS